MEHFDYLGDYRVESQLGSGSFASVWLAHDDQLQAPVAVKVLADHWAQDAPVVQRFLEEARLLRRIDDDHVVRVYAVGELDIGRPFFAMEWADGGTLADRLDAREGPLELGEALSVAVGLLDGLAAVHSLGAVHRDIKPSNVLFKSLPQHVRSVGSTEKVLVGDLGLATDLTISTGSIPTAGTPAYMAPEQISPVGIVDQRADLFAVAAVLYEMLAGRETGLLWSPSAGAGQDPVITVSRSTNVAIPDRIWDVIERGLALDPADRFSSAEEFSSALDRSWRPSSAQTLPTGTLTLLFSDIEGSTRLWDQHPDSMADALERHDALMRSVIEGHGGYVFKTVGDAFCAAFAAARDAVGAAGAAQRALHAEAWSEGVILRVRMALHTGECEERNGDYFGPAVNRTARLETTAHGGQIVISRSTADVVRDRLPTGMGLVDLGRHHLKDLERPEDVFQLSVDGLPSDFPPLRALVDIETPVARPVKLADHRRLSRRSVWAGIALLVLVLLVATATFTVISRGGPNNASIAPPGAAAKSGPSPLIVAEDLGPGWTGGGPLPVAANLNIPSLFSCSAVTAPSPQKPIFQEEGEYYPPNADSTFIQNADSTFIQEDVYQFHTVHEADEAATWLDQVVAKCGLPILDTYGNIVGRESPAALAPTPHQFCQRTSTFGPVSGPGTSGYGDGTVCKSTVIVLGLTEPPGSHLGVSELSGFLGAAVTRVLADLSVSSTLPAPPAVPSTDVLQNQLLTAADLGPSWRADSMLHPPHVAPYNCGGPGVPAPSQPPFSSRFATVGYGNGNGTVIQELVYFAHLSDAALLMEDNEEINRLCTFPVGEEVAPRWVIDRSAPTACDQSFVARPVITQSSTGAYKLFVRCGHAVSLLWVTPDPNDASQIPNLSSLLPLVAANTSAASH